MNLNIFLSSLRLGFLIYNIVIMIPIVIVRVHWLLATNLKEREFIEKMLRKFLEYMEGHKTRIIDGQEIGLPWWGFKRQKHFLSF